MEFIYRPEITLKGTHEECVKAAARIRTVITALRDVQDVDGSLSDDTILAQSDPDLDMPLPSDMRTQLTYMVATAAQENQFGDGLEAEYILHGCHMEGIMNLSERALLAEAQALLDLDEDAALLATMQPYLTYHGL